MFRHWKPIAWLVGASILCLALLFALSDGGRVFENPLFQGLFGALIFVTIFIALFYFFILARLARKLFHQTKLLHSEVEISWTPDALTFAADWGSTEIAWGDYHKWLENDRLFILFQSDAAYNILPKTVLGEDSVQEIGRNLTEAGVTKG